MPPFIQDEPARAENEVPTSRFTYRDLRNLGRSSTSCPLRVIALIDFDAFYAQCETVRLGLAEDQPLAVVQFNHCIALNYAAKAAGLKRIISPEEAKKQCPHVVLQHVATWREGDSKWAYREDAKEHMRTDKAALDPYRLQSRTAFDLIKSKLPASPMQKVEKASIDEVYLDLSAQVHALILERHLVLSGGLAEHDQDSHLPTPPSTLDWGSDMLVETSSEEEAKLPDWDDVALNIGAEIVRQVRAEVYNTLRFTCSAGIARNKTISKLAAGHNKPNKQTVVRDRAIAPFLAQYKFPKIRGLGGKLGQKVVDACGTDETSELLGVSLQELRAKLGSESGTWVYNTIRGNEYSEVVERTQLQSMLAAKTFVPKAVDMEQAEKWLRIFAGDIMGRLEEQDATTKQRRPKVIQLHHAINGRFGPTRSKQMQIPLGAQITAGLLFDMARALLIQLSQEGPTWPCLTISVAVTDFEDGVTNNRHMTSFFAPKNATDTRVNELGGTKIPDDSAQQGEMKRKRTEEDTDRTSKRLGKTSIQHWLATPPAQSPRSEDSITLPAREGGTLEANGGSYRCPKCDTNVVSPEVLEHLDWHIAMELQDGQ